MEPMLHRTLGGAAVRIAGQALTMTPPFKLTFWYLPSDVDCHRLQTPAVKLSLIHVASRKFFADQPHLVEICAMSDRGFAGV